MDILFQAKHRTKSAEAGLLNMHGIIQLTDSAVIIINETQESGNTTTL